MSKLPSPTVKELALAKRAGYKGSRPKRPRKNATLPFIEKYIDRHNTWVSKVRAAANSEAKRQALIKTIYK